jgi:demethylmenaquinone methyltransferase/2-methoxy-6-polyprenyl-1,4-benzoquinol methylase
VDRLRLKDPGAIAGMFDAIAPRYDALNHILSLGIDRRWRRRAVDTLNLRGGETILDVCSGTADLAIGAVRMQPRVVVGVDFAPRMLQIGQQKIVRRGLTHQIRLIRGDAQRLPVRAASVDALTVGFGIRNVFDPRAALAEFARVVKPGGRIALLEFGEPRLPFIGNAYLWYFTHVLPRIGRAVSQHGEAYSYLRESVRAFPRPEQFSRWVEDAGFREVRAVSLTLGIVYLYTAARRQGSATGSGL